MKKIEMHAKTFRLPERTTHEELECRWSHVLKFGDRVLLAGYFFAYKGADWFGAIYRFTTDDHTCEGQIELVEVSQEFFEDEGHAIAWAMGK